jgi:hypothetical protein
MKQLIAHEPVATGDILKIVAWLVATLLSVGALTAADADQVNAFAAVLAPAAALLINAAVAWWQRSQVTPMADPRDDDGNPLYADEVMVP